MEPKKIIVVVGLPYSGKSTYIRNNFKDATVISNNTIVEAYAKEKNLSFAQTLPLMTNKLRHVIGQRLFKNAVKRKDALIIINDCNLTKMKRNMFLLPIAKLYRKEAIVFPPDLEILFKRNALRAKYNKKTIPEKVFRSMFKKYEPVTYEEKFDKITYIKLTE